MSTSNQEPVVLSMKECRELLASREVGRLAWANAGKPRILPVSYTCIDDHIVIRTLPGRILSQLTRPSPIVFEVDDLDEAGQQGWSVIASGTSGSIAPDEAARVLKSELVEPWSPGERTLLVAITVTTLTGRRFGPQHRAEVAPTPPGHGARR